MSLLTLLPLEAEHELAPMIADPLVFAGIAAAAFLMMGLVSWSFRDVYHRHNHKTSNAPDSPAQH